MMKSLLIASSLLAFSMTTTACDAEHDESTVESRQLHDAELSAEDALAATDEAAPDALVVGVEFIAGVDAGYFEVLAFDGDDEVTFEVEVDRHRAREVDRRRANRDRLARARRHARRRLAAALADRRDRRRGERIAAARLGDREAEVDVVDRRGKRRRRRLALD